MPPGTLIDPVVLFCPASMSKLLGVPSKAASLMAVDCELPQPRRTSAIPTSERTLIVGHFTTIDVVDSLGIEANPRRSSRLTVLAVPSTAFSRGATTQPPSRSCVESALVCCLTVTLDE